MAIKRSNTKKVLTGNTSPMPDNVAVSKSWYKTLLGWCAEQGCGCEKIKGHTMNPSVDLPCDQCKSRAILKGEARSW